MTDRQMENQNHLQNFVQRHDRQSALHRIVLSTMFRILKEKNYGLDFGCKTREIKAKYPSNYYWRWKIVFISESILIGRNHLLALSAKPDRFVSDGTRKKCN